MVGQFKPAAFVRALQYAEDQHAKPYVRYPGRFRPVPAPLARGMPLATLAS